MLISFILPVYNVEKYLSNCIESILVQQGATYEIVLIDDGSTDSSGRICDQYALQYPDRIRVIHKENEGLLLTRRRGFAEARGEWLACVDSDDYIKPDYLMTISKTIQKYDCDMIMFDYESFYPDGHIEPSGINITDAKTYEGKTKKNIYTKRLLKNKYNNMWSKVIKKSVIDQNLDYSVYGVKNMCEDAIQSFELYTRANKIVFVPHVLYSYRRNIKSITSNITVDYWYSMRISYDLGWTYINVWRLGEKIVNAYGARCVAFYCDYLRWLIKENSKKSISDLNRVLDETVRETDSYKNAISHYEKKYLATKYLRLCDPMMINLVKTRSTTWLLIMLVQIETKIQDVRNKK